MKRFSTFLLTLMLLVFTTEAFAQGGPRRVEVYGDDTKSAAIGDFITATDGVQCEVLSENMVQNHSFELGLSGTWVNTADWTTPIAEPDFIQDDTKPLCDGAQYLVGKTNGGASSTGSLGNAWKLEKGKTYYFSYWVKSLTGATNGEYLKVSKTNTVGKEPSDAGYESSSDWLINGSTVQGDGEWQQIDAYFTNTEGYEYLQVKFRWLNGQWGFDKFEVYEVDAYTDTESDYYEGDLIIMNEGEKDEARYVAMSNNMVDNHSFELGLVDWYSSNISFDASGDPVLTQITSTNFSLLTDDPQDGKRYLVGVNSDVANSAKSLFNYWELKPSTSYYFSYYIKAQKKEENDAQYIKTSLTNTLGDEPNIIDDGTGATTPTTWKKIEVQFDNGAEGDADYYKYLQIKFRWLDGLWGFDNFQLYEVEEAEPELIVHEEEAELNDWSRTGTDGSFQKNTWSGEEDASEMVTPFIEYWKGTGYTLADDVLSHKTITTDDNGDALKGGFYTMSIDVRAFNEKSLKNVKPGTITLEANGTTVDISLGSVDLYANVSAETYGTFEVPFIVEEDASGNNSIDIKFTIKGTNCDWFAFKNLVVTYMGTGQDMPSASELTKVTGTMSATAAAAQDAAFEAYEQSHNPDNLIALYQALVDAKLSANYYAELEPLVKALDEAGAKVWAATTSGTNYADLKVTDDYTTDMADAQAAQTTAGSDMTYVMRYGGTNTSVGSWMKDASNKAGATNPVFNTDTYENYGTFTEGTVLYKTITGLAPGMYTVSFYANASNNSEGGTSAVENGAAVYANDATVLIDVNQLTGSGMLETNWSEDQLRTVTCAVNTSGTLEYGMKYVSGGKWYVVMDENLNASLTLVSDLESESEYTTGKIITVDGVDYEVASENLIDNHSFEQGVVNWYTTDDGNSGAGIFTEEISQENFAFMSDGASDGDWYIVGTEDGGKDSPLSLGNYWELDKSTSYYFSFDIKAMGEDTNASTLSVSLTNELGVNTRTQDLMDGVNPVSSDWQRVEMVFRNSDYKYLQMIFYELQGKWGFDNFQLYALTTPTVIDLVAHEEVDGTATGTKKDGTDYPTMVEEFEHWSTTGNNGAFHVNDWSVEADASGMVVPFFENWVYGETLTDATISHKTLVGLPAGTYDVSMDIRLFSEQGLAMAKGTTFNANDASEDLVTGDDANAGVYGTETEFYGNYKLAATVGTDGLLDISIVIPEEGVTYNWIAFKNLKVSMTTTVTEDMPVIEALEGKMSAEAEDAMTKAIAAYEAAIEADPLVVADVESTFTAAIDALQAAQESIEEYAELAALVDALDEAGKKVWDATESGEAYEAGTLDDTIDWTADMADAVKSQTTEGSDMTFGMLNSGEWIGQTGTYKTDYVERYAGNGVNFEEGEALYKNIEGLTPGVYEVTFYAVASAAEWVAGVDYGEGIAQIFANDVTQDIEVIEQESCDPTEYECTLTCIVGEDGTLSFGLQTIAEGGNWFVAQAVSLTYLGGYVEPISDDEYAEGDNVEVDGQNYKVTSGNLFVNGGFNEAINEDGTVPGWTSSNAYTDPLLAENVIIKTEGGFNGGGYLTLPESVGATSEHTPTQAIAVTPGNTYLFIGYTNGTEPTDANVRYSALFAMQSATEESHHDENGTSFGDDIITLDWESDGEWTKTIGVFTATTEYVGMRMNWSEGSYDGFQLYEVNAPRITPGDYLVVNPETGNYLAGGLYWGTEAMEGGKPQFISFDATDDGRYILDSHQSNGGDSHYIGVTAANEMYFDTAGCTWLVLKDVNTDLIYIGTEIVTGTKEVTDPDTGETETQDVKELRWVKSRGFQNAVEWVESVADCTPWTLVTKADVLATMEDATEDEPVDVTALIPAAEPKRNNWGDSWSATGYGVEDAPANYSIGQGENVASVAESYHSTNGFDFTQIVPDLPVGTYELTAQAFYRNDGGEEFEPVVPVMYVDDATAELPELQTELTDEEIAAGITVPANMVDAYQAFLLEEYPVSVMFYVAEEGDVTVGFTGLTEGDDQLWTIFGELSLLYYGEENLTEPEPVPVPDTEHECVAEFDHWSIAGNTNGTFQYNDWSTEADASGMVKPFVEYWVWIGDDKDATLSAATISHYTLNMEPGTYQVSLDARIYSEAGNEIGEGTTLNANDASVDLVEAGTADVYGTENLVYGTYTLICEVGEDGTLDISINIPEGVTYNWIAWKNLSVTPVEEPTIEPGTVVHECVAEVDHWTIEGNTNGDFHYNDWSVEADASGMVVPFLEYWVGSWEGNLSAATISHETLEDLPAGAYEVTLDIRIFSEAGNDISAGTTLNANGENVDLWIAGTDGVYGTETEVYGTYTVACMVGEDGTLDICIDIPSGVSYNWIAFKNLTVTYIGEELPADNSYQFVCTDWGSIDTGRVADSNVTYDEDSNTIIVTADGNCNVALSNGREEPFTTEDYTVSSEQNWFVVVGSDLSMADKDSYLWWMNGYNEGMQIVPDYVVELEDGEILLAWDLASTVAGTNLQDDENYLDGWTGFGLTSTTGVSVISDINFYTWKEALANYPELATAIATKISGIGNGAGVAEGIYTLSGVRISKITKSGIYIVDGKKVLVK